MMTFAGVEPVRAKVTVDRKIIEEVSTFGIFRLCNIV
jgi:hypothetical protein